MSDAWEGLSRLELLRVLDAVLAGQITREDASSWAVALLAFDIDEPVVDDALSFLAVLDALQVDDEMNPIGYMFDLDQVADVRAAVADLPG